MRARALSTRIARGAALVAVAVGLTVGAAAAPAAAATPVASNLTITGIGQGQYRIEVSGVIPMDQYDAHGFINNIGTGGMRYRVHGWDGLSGAQPRGTTYSSGASMPGTHAGGWLYAGAEGIHYHRVFTVTGSVLNEDSGWWEDPQDEITVRSYFVDGDGGIRGDNLSNIVAGFF